MILSNFTIRRLLFFRGKLFFFELFGAVIILWQGVPMYHALLAGNFDKAEMSFKIWTTIAIVLIQSCYWFRYIHQASSEQPKQMILGHAIIFIARLNFIFASGIFSTIFYTRFDQVHFSVQGLMILFGILFSMFCVTFDAERIGKAFLEGKFSSTESP